MANQATKQQKPRVFIGSSSEARSVVKEFKEVLSRDAKMIAWWESPEFKPLQSIFSGLMETVDKSISAYDFGLFILAADDVLISRGKKSSTPRDNVLFELGLFLGAFGPDRTFAVIQKDTSRKANLPSDFGGIIIPPFAASNKTRMKESIGAAAGQFRKLIKDKGPRPLEEKLVVKRLEWEFSWKEKAFKLTVPEEIVRQNQPVLKGKKLLLIAMKSDDGTELELNTNIALSAPRGIGRLPQAITMRAPDNTGRKNIFSNISEGLEVEGRVFALPSSLEIKPGMVIKDFLNLGAEFAFGGACNALRNQSKH